MNVLSRAYWTAKGVGFDNVPRRLLQAWRMKTGALRRRLDPALYDDAAYRAATGATAEGQRARWSARSARFFALPDDAALQGVAGDGLWDEWVLKPCRMALAGDYPFFSRWTGRLGWPPNFNLDPMHEIDWPVGEHWTGTTRSGPPRHDIKLVWEASRLTLAYTLARAYRRDRDERWAQALWQMLDAWFEQNPPQLTVAWGCGQETAFRLMAMLTGVMATLNSAHATDARLDAVERFAWQSAKRIEVNINYAISQENNHGVSEALGLWTVGLLFDGFAESQRWRDSGAKHIAAECARQIYDDGSFVQHSMSYHRVMLDDMMWALRLGEVCDAPLPTVVMDRFRRATDWLAQFVDLVSGRVPNYGSNDGANVLPLSCSDYLDYRPTVQAAHVIAHGKRCLEPGPWDEKAMWLCGKLPAGEVAPTERAATWSAPDGGYYVLRGANGWVMTRCCAFADRPHQSDQLHVDLWHRGENVLRDAGSYLYYDDDPKWAHYFHAATAHNTVTFGDADHMTKGPRFLWFHWPKGKGGLVSSARFEGAMTLPNKPGALVERSIDRVGENVYRVTDRVTGGEPVVRWRLMPGHWRHEADGRWSIDVAGEPWVICVTGDAGMRCELIDGWESLYYGEKTMCPVIEVTGAGVVSTWAGPAAAVTRAMAESGGEAD